MSRKTLAELYKDLEIAEQAIGPARRAVLLKAGWKYTSEIGSVWLWYKVVKDRQIFVDTTTALLITESEIDEG